MPHYLISFYFFLVYMFVFFYDYGYLMKLNIYTFQMRLRMNCLFGVCFNGFILAGMLLSVHKDLRHL